jgi:hypothetical protein
MKMLHGYGARDHNQGTYAKKKFYTPTLDVDVSDV